MPVYPFTHKHRRTVIDANDRHQPTDIASCDLCNDVAHEAPDGASVFNDNRFAHSILYKHCTIAAEHFHYQAGWRDDWFHYPALSPEERAEFDRRTSG